MLDKYVFTCQNLFLEICFCFQYVHEPTYYYISNGSQYHVSLHIWTTPCRNIHYTYNQIRNKKSLSVFLLSIDMGFHKSKMQVKETFILYLTQLNLRTLNNININKKSKVLLSNYSRVTIDKMENLDS